MLRFENDGGLVDFRRVWSRLIVSTLAYAYYFLIYGWVGLIE